jgi:hypothetical protein
LALALAGATFASIYHFIACMTVTASLGLYVLFGTRPSWPAGSMWRLGAGFGMFACITGWFFLGLFSAYKAGSYVGAHEPITFSVDLLGIVLPNPVSYWSNGVPAWRHWIAARWGGSTGLWAGAAGIGIVNLALVCWAWLSSAYSRRFILVAAVGTALALGPVLQVNGTVTAMRMPYGWLSAALPMLTFGGVPSRFMEVAIFGIAVATCGVFCRLWNRGIRTQVVAILVVCLSIGEAWPKSFPTFSYGVPDKLLDIAVEAGQFAVLDATWWSRALYHQTIHGHPILTGYVSRLPSEKVAGLMSDRALFQFYRQLLPPTSAEVSTASPEETLQRLHIMSVRYVIVDASRSDVPASIGLSKIYSDSTVALFKVPDSVAAQNVVVNGQ